MSWIVWERIRYRNNGKGLCFGLIISYDDFKGVCLAVGLYELKIGKGANL